MMGLLWEEMLPFRLAQIAPGCDACEADQLLQRKRSQAIHSFFRIAPEREWIFADCD
jgi:hypothetical protein